MTAGEMHVALAQWKAAVEVNGKGFPLESELLELMVIGADLENARLRKGLLGYFEKTAPPAVKALSGPYLKQMEQIFNAKEIR